MRPLLFVAAPLPLGYRERMAESWAMILSFFSDDVSFCA